MSCHTCCNPYTHAAWVHIGANQYPPEGKILLILQVRFWISTMKHNIRGKALELTNDHSLLAHKTFALPVLSDLLLHFLAQCQTKGSIFAVLSLGGYSVAFATRHRIVR